VGNLQPRSPALLRDVSRRGGQVSEGGKGPTLPGQHTQVGLPLDDALLEQQVSRQTAV